MNRQEIKDQIKGQLLTIINETEGNITSDQLYNLLVGQINPGRTQETIRKYIRELVNAEDNLIGSSEKGFFKNKHF